MLSVQESVQRAAAQGDGVVRAHFMAAVAADAVARLNLRDTLLNRDDLHRAGIAARAAADAFVGQNLRADAERLFENRRKQAQGDRSGAAQHGGRELKTWNAQFLFF